MSKLSTRILAFVGVLVFAASLTGCSWSQTPEPGQSTPTPPVTTTRPSGSGDSAQEVLSVGPARVFLSDFLYFHGDTRLPDGTFLKSQLYEGSGAVPWWPTDRPITTENGTWEIKFVLGVNGAPARLKTGPSYRFKVWQETDPAVQAMFYFDLVGPPPAVDSWWRQVLQVLDDLFHGRLWRNPAPRTPDSPINRVMALMFAAKSVPSDVIKTASKSADLNDGVWRIIFFLPHSSVTRDQLNWPDDPDTSFENHGRLPSGSFSVLRLFINGTSGAVLLRQASDGFIVGPMDGETEMPDNRVPPWTNIASGIGGLLVGGAIVWLASGRRSKRIKNQNINP